MKITEQQSREAFEKKFGVPIGSRRGEWYGSQGNSDRWEGWQAALKLAEGQSNQPEPFGIPQETAILPKPPPHYHLATDEERKRLPEGSKAHDAGDVWVKSSNIGKDVSGFSVIYACPDASSLVTFTDGKLNPPPLGQWHREDWTPEMLAGGWRPLLLGEQECPEDESSWDGLTWENNGKAHRYQSLGLAACNWILHRTRRPLPAPPAEEWVELGPEDVPPGSVFRNIGSYNGAWLAPTVVHAGGVELAGALTGFETLAKEKEILRPGQNWQPCKKLKTK
jgi:hypothetical protein